MIHLPTNRAIFDAKTLRMFPHGTRIYAISPQVRAIASADEDGWEHVSVSCQNRCPTWDEMCEVKDFFWDQEDTVLQLHPAKSVYLNIHEYCLHLWRPVDGQLILPPEARP